MKTGKKILIDFLLVITSMSISSLIISLVYRVVSLFLDLEKINPKAIFIAWGVVVFLVKIFIVDKCYKTILNIQKTSIVCDKEELKTKKFFFKRNAYKKAQKMRNKGGTAWVLPPLPGTCCWSCNWYE